MISGIKARRVRGLYDVDVALGSVNLLVGANGTGKSTFVDLFQLIADAVAGGLPEALLARGDLVAYRRASVGRGRPNALRVSLTIAETPAWGIVRASYEFELEATLELAVRRESLDARLLPRRRGKPAKDRTRWYDEASPVDVQLERDRDSYRGTPELVDRTNAVDVAPDDLALRQLAWGPLTNLQTYLRSMRTYSLVPAWVRQPGRHRASGGLDPSGANLAAVWRRLPTGTREGILRLLRDVVPYVEGVEVEALGSLSGLQLSERDTGFTIPYEGISDGTLRALAVLVAVLGPEPASVMCLEELENALHPAGVERLLELIRHEATAGVTQFVITSHHPHVIDMALVPADDAPARVYASYRRRGECRIEEVTGPLQAIVDDNLGRPSEFWIQDGLDDFPVAVPPAGAGR